MRILITIILLVATNSLFAQVEKNDTLIVQTKIYCDHCKECETCQPHIEKELNFTKGVKAFTVNVQSQTIMVVYNPKKTNALNIRQAIANSGYDADEIKAEPKAVAKLDGCCQKT